MLTEKLKQFCMWWLVNVPFRAVKMQSWKNEYVWALQWKFNKPWIINRSKRRRVWLWWNRHCYKEEGTKLMMKKRGIGIKRRVTHG